MHDIAKDIVLFLKKVDINGFEVIDLGVDIQADKFVEAVQECQARVVGLSGFLTRTIEPMRDTISALKRAGLADVKVTIGGGLVHKVVSRRMVKNQQMRWTQRGVLLPHQVRARTLNNELRDIFVAGIQVWQTLTNLYCLLLSTWFFLVSSFC